MKRNVLVVFLLLSVSVIWANSALEVSFPDPEKVLTVVVPYGAGGGTDLAFRPLVEEMKKVAGVNVIVSNIGGAGSATGTNEVLNMEADGYTLFASGTHTIGATLQGLTDGYKSLDGLTGLNWDPFIIAVSINSPWTTFKELVDAGSVNPKDISLGNAGMGGATGVGSIGLNLSLDKIFNVTPFNGGKDLMAAVLGGHCDIGIFSQSEILANKEMLRPLVMLYPERSRLSGLETVPTLDEAGFPGISIPAGSFKSFSVKTGTPEDVKKKLVEIITEAYNSDTYQNFMQEKGLIPTFSSLDEYAVYEESIIAEFLPIVVESGLFKE